MSKKSHPICKKESKGFYLEDNYESGHYETMNRLYTRDENKFIPIGWICNNCHKTIFDYEIKEFVQENKDNLENMDSYKWYKRIEINNILVSNPLVYLES